MVTNNNISQGFENSYNSYEQYPLEKFFIYTIYQNYPLAYLKMIILNQLASIHGCYPIKAKVWLWWIVKKKMSLGPFTLPC